MSFSLGNSNLETKFFAFIQDSLFRVVLFSLFSISCFGMTLEEKVGQLLMVHFRGETVNDDAKTLIQEVKVGGIIYYNWANGLNSLTQVKTLSANLQALAEIPLLIAADQEGGIVSRLNQGFTSFPGNRALGETKDPNLAELSALSMGEEMKAAGVNMNLAPVVDINSNPKNPIIGIRSYSDDPKTVVDFAEHALRGFAAAKVLSTLKHFPGHGDVSVDSHEALPLVDKTLEDLKKVELLPFIKLSPLADAIMTAHILVPSLDPDNCATLSKKTLDYLRNEIGFQGVIVSDSLVMEGVLKKSGTIEEASILALNAGCDLLILGGKALVGSDRLELTVSDMKRVHASIVEAVKSGRILETRIDEALNRVLKLKIKYRSEEGVFIPDHFAIAKKIAAQALKIKSSKPVSSLQNKLLFAVAPKQLQENIEKAKIAKLGKSTDFYFFETFNSSSEEIEEICFKASQADVLLVFSYNAWKTPSQQVLIQSLFSMQKPLILLVVRDPIDSDLFPEADLTLESFSPSLSSLEAIFDCLERLGFFLLTQAMD